MGHAGKENSIQQCKIYTTFVLPINNYCFRGKQSIQEWSLDSVRLFIYFCCFCCSNPLCKLRRPIILNLLLSLSFNKQSH